MTRLTAHDRVRVHEDEEVFAVVYGNEEGRWADLGCVVRVGFLAHLPVTKIRFVHEDEDLDKPSDGRS